MKETEEAIVKAVKRWFETVVLGLNLCPFARNPYLQDKIEFVLSGADNDEACLSELYLNLLGLEQQPEIETTVLICVNHLKVFSDYNQFLELADQLIEQQGWTGIYQVASFHPDYRFAGCEHDAIDNWTNRSPYPLLHLLREDSITEAVKAYKDVNSIAEQNIARLRALSDSQKKSIFGSGIKIKKSRE